MLLVNGRSILLLLCGPGTESRYAEEFGSELAEIALAGGGRAAQLEYAARQLMSSVRLRADLKAPRRRSAVL